MSAASEVFNILELRDAIVDEITDPRTYYMYVHVSKGDVAFDMLQAHADED